MGLMGPLVVLPVLCLWVGLRGPPGVVLGDLTTWSLLGAKKTSWSDF